MYRAFLISEKLYLRSLEESDSNEEYLSWLNDSDVTRYLQSGKFPATLSSLRAYLQRFEDSTADLIFAIVDKETEQHIGNVTLNRINWISQTADTGIMIGRKEFWGRGYAFDAWSLVIEYAFNRLGLRKLIAGAYQDHPASVRVLKKLGFKQEGILRKINLVDGKYLDGICMGMFREEFHKYSPTMDSGGF